MDTVSASSFGIVETIIGLSQYFCKYLLERFGRFSSRLPGGDTNAHRHPAFGRIFMGQVQVFYRPSGLLSHNQRTVGIMLR